jgi:hypothetical protein
MRLPIVGLEIEDAGRRIDLARLELKALPLTGVLITEKVAAEIGD